MNTRRTSNAIARRIRRAMGEEESVVSVIIVLSRGGILHRKRVRKKREVRGISSGVWVGRCRKT
jgi:hypothetical protein